MRRKSNVFITLNVNDVAKPETTWVSGAFSNIEDAVARGYERLGGKDGMFFVREQTVDRDSKLATLFRCTANVSTRTIGIVSGIGCFFRHVDEEGKVTPIP